MDKVKMKKLVDLWVKTGGDAVQSFDGDIEGKLGAFLKAHNAILLELEKAAKKK